MYRKCTHRMSGLKAFIVIEIADVYKHDKIKGKR